MTAAKPMISATLLDIKGSEHLLAVDSQWSIEHDGVALNAYGRHLGAVAAAALAQVNTVQTIGEFKYEITLNYQDSLDMHEAATIDGLEADISTNYSDYIAVLTRSKFAPLSHNLLHIGHGKHARVLCMTDIRDDALARELIKRSVDTAPVSRKGDVIEHLIYTYEGKRKVLELGAQRRALNKQYKYEIPRRRHRDDDNSQSPIEDAIPQPTFIVSEHVSRTVGQHVLSRVNGAVFDIVSIGRELRVADGDHEKIMTALNILVRSGYLQVRMSANDVVEYVRTSLRR